VLIIGLAASAALFAWGSGSADATAPEAGLPDTAESARVDALQKQLPDHDVTSALFVFAREGSDLTDSDMAAVTERADDLADFSAEEFVPPPALSDDRSAALVVVPLQEEDNVSKRADRAAEMRQVARADLPEGLTSLMSGPEGFAVDVAAVFKGADFTLLLTTAIVVAVLLLVTYRSPWLWLVPLSVVGLADALASIVAARLASGFGITLDASITGILSVLVFGAGTNYALLLIARYRDELRLNESRHDAMNNAVRGAGPAIIASGSTVMTSLLMLLFGQLTGNQALGLACAAGILVAMLGALTVLPAALLLFGRRLFWPYVPRFGSENKADRGLWFRLGTAVSRRPIMVAIVGAVILGAMALGVPQIQVGLAQTESFTTKPEAVTGQQVIADAFPAGSGSPATVIVNAGFEEEATRVIDSLDGVDSVRAGPGNSDIAELDVTLAAAAETDDAFDSIIELRSELDEVDGADALVGGLDARSLDVTTAQAADEALIIPLILVVVLLVLMLLLRALLAPVLLLLTVVASFFASIGASWLLFTSVFDFPAFDTSVVLFSFLFLVALGVDYNIFLVTRAKEESERHGTRQGMIRALSGTGGVITSAGILLAAVFAMLGVLPLITLTQIGIVVCLGVLIDTLLVRTVIVPALAFIAGDRFWWPRKLAR
jgi:RND superfamily putative drug exporter